MADKAVLERRPLGILPELLYSLHSARSSSRLEHGPLKARPHRYAKRCGRAGARVRVRMLSS
jgi:hypothetical protein